MHLFDNNEVIGLTRMTRMTRRIALTRMNSCPTMLHAKNMILRKGGIPCNMVYVVIQYVIDSKHSLLRPLLPC